MPHPIEKIVPNSICVRNGKMQGVEVHGEGVYWA